MSGQLGYDKGANDLKPRAAHPGIYLTAEKNFEKTQIRDPLKASNETPYFQMASIG